MTIDDTNPNNDIFRTKRSPNFEIGTPNSEQSVTELAKLTLQAMTHSYGGWWLIVIASALLMTINLLVVVKILCDGYKRHKETRSHNTKVVHSVLTHTRAREG